MDYRLAARRVASDDEVLDDGRRAGFGQLGGGVGGGDADHLTDSGGHRGADAGG